MWAKSGITRRSPIWHILLHSSAIVGNTIDCTEALPSRLSLPAKTCCSTPVRGTLIKSNSFNDTGPNQVRIAADYAD